ncbi:carboxypeptidase regulatory-like domain-containing protein [Terriglobus sp.]|uniref:carboxypeptidase regulatory-like domain-containing protein n=1 Tax=Terriglobus sp. TaxID=1889013 RepID=UPI003AFF692D
MKKNLLGLALAAVSVSAALVPLASAQSVTAGDINGVLTDPTGAAVPGAQVTVTNALTGAAKTVTTSGTGGYRVALLPPGTYKVSVTATGFATTANQVAVSAGSVTTDDLKLSVGQSNATVEVTAEPLTLNTENADINTTFTAEQVQALPNPGNDLTFVAQTAPGSIMNTGTAAGGYGNFSSFGISGLSNLFTLDGGYENDPFLNLNNTGASNLTLGNNEVETVTVVSPAYSSQFGGLGGAQVNEITTSGGNRVHGRAQYYWSGRALNANDYFNKQSQVFNGEKNQAQFVNANQWAASIGGPVIHDRLFWYVNTEGLRVTTPTSGQVYAPSPAFQQCSLTGTNCATLNAAAAADAANNPNSTQVGPFSQAPASQVPLLSAIYGVYNKSPFRPSSGVVADPNDVSAVSYYAKSAAFLSEWLLTARVDYRISGKDSIYVHYKQDHGTQPTYVDLIDPRFSALSPQPAWEGQINETHTFSPNVINQLVIAGNYYSAPFQNTNNYLPVAPFTFAFIDGDLQNTDYGGENYAFPQGRRVAGYQIVDDLSWNRGRNTLRWGYNFRRDNVTDLPQSRAVATLDEGSVEAFGAGLESFVHSQYFPLRQEEPIAVFNQGAYVEDAYKLIPNFTITAGLRIESNSNPTCLANCFAVLNSDATSLPTGAASTTIPYNQLISAGRHQTFKDYQVVAFMPRLSFAYQPSVGSKTVIRGGFGLFTDTFPGLIAERLLTNAPNVFRATVYGPDGGGPNDLNLDPGTAGSGGAVARASYTAFQNQFAGGGTYASTAAAVAAAGGSYSAPAFSTVAGKVKYPTYEEFNLAIERQLDRKSSIGVTYVGNHGFHEPVADGTRNLSSTGSTSTSTSTGKKPFGANFFPGIPTARPVTPLAGITNYYSGASSNFNGVVATATRRSANLTLQVNYQFSKALDEISNGGIEPFAPDAGDAASVSNPSSLHTQYGRADYDVRHNTSASFVWQVPSYHRLRAITGGFEFSGAIFHQSGLPYSILQSSTSVGSGTGVGAGTTSFANGTVNLLARQVSNNFDHHCGGSSHVLLPDGSVANRCNFTSTSAFAAPTSFYQQGRNTLTGPSYTNVDFGANKVIPIYKLEWVKLKLGAQFFNLFNHTNFQNPGHTLTGSGTSAYGAISSTVSSPTNIFGSVGANSSPRLIQLKGSINF